MSGDFANQVKEELTTYGKALAKAGKLRFIGIVSRVLGLFLFIFTIVLCLLALFTFAAVAAIDALATCMPVWAAALIIGSAYLVIIVIAVLCRKPLFIHPFIRLLTKQVHSEEELALRIMDAEHEADLQRVRMQGQIENVVDQVNLYTNVLSHLWHWIKRIFRKKH